MDRLILLLLSCSRIEADEPKPPEPLDTGHQPPTPPSEVAPEVLPEDVLLEVLDQTRGHRLRLDAQWIWREAWHGQPERVRSPWQPLPPHPDAARLRAETTLELWAPLLQKLDGQEIVSAAQGRSASGQMIASSVLLFRARSGSRVSAVQVRGDLASPATLGPLEEAWRALSREVYGPKP